MRRYIAKWMKKVGYHPETGDVEPDLCEYAEKNFGIAKTALKSAARYACNHNCYGSEGFVDVEEWNADVFGDGSMCGGWECVERWLCQDRKVIGRVDNI